MRVRGGSGPARRIKHEGDAERKSVVVTLPMMCLKDSETGITCKHLGYGRPAVDREGRSDVLLVGDITYPLCTAEQRGPCTGKEEREDGFDDIGVRRDV
jgi:hypothetical protein